MKNQFRSIDYRPEDGWYWYQDENGEVKDTTRLGITVKLTEHLRKHGKRVPPDPFVLVMDFMCPRLPDGVCNKPSTLKRVSMDEVKDNTRKFFGKPVESADVISERLSKCHECPKHNRSFCPGCTGLPEWISRGFGSARRPLPADLASGVCTCDKTLVSAAATPSDQTEFRLGEEAPDGCWRK